MRAQVRGLATPNVEEVTTTVRETNEQMVEVMHDTERRGDDAGVDETTVRAEVERALRDLEQESRESQRIIPVTVIDQARAPGGEVDRAHLRLMLQQRSNSDSILELQEAHADILFARAVWGSILRKKSGGHAAPLDLPGLTARLNTALRGVGMSTRDITTTGAGTGDEWAFDEQEAIPIPRVALNGFVAQAFMQKTIPMARESLTIPGYGARTTVKTVGEGSSIAESTPGTRQVTFTPTKHAARTQLTQETIEDLIIAVMADLQAQMADDLQRGSDHCVISGDVASGMDSDQGAGDVDDAWDGLRHIAISDLTAATLDMNSLATAGDVRKLRALMGIYGVDPGQLVHIMGPLRYSSLMDDDDLKTLDKVGPRATILTGSYSMIQGIPVLVTDQFREDLNVSGVFDNTTKDNHAHLIARIGGWAMGTKTGVIIETDKNITTQLWDVVATARRVFKSLYPTTENVVAYGFNLDN